MVAGLLKNAQLCVVGGVPSRGVANICSVTNTWVLLTNRIVRWCRALDLHGYVVETPVRINARLEEVVLRSRRPAPYGDPTVLFDVRELWHPGKDPDELSLEAEGHYMQGASWNAQIDGNRPKNAERLDVDRSKSRSLIVHRHPYGQPNHVREPSRLLSPERWLQDIEEIVFECYAALQDEQD
jgi:hypothetical protein